MPQRGDERIFHRRQSHWDIGRRGSGRAAVFHGGDAGESVFVGWEGCRALLPVCGAGRRCECLCDPDGTGVAAGAGEISKWTAHPGSPAAPSHRHPPGGGRCGALRHQHHRESAGSQASLPVPWGGRPHERLWPGQRNGVSRDDVPCLHFVCPGRAADSRAGAVQCRREKGTNRVFGAAGAMVSHGVWDIFRRAGLSLCPAPVPSPVSQCSGRQQSSILCGDDSLFILRCHYRCHDQGTGAAKNMRPV